MDCFIGLDFVSIGLGVLLPGPDFVSMGLDCGLIALDVINATI